MPEGFPQARYAQRSPAETVWTSLLFSVVTNINRRDSEKASLRRDMMNASSILGTVPETPVSTEEKLSPLDLTIPLVSSDHEAKGWSEDELRGFLRELLEKKQGIEDTLDEIIELLTPLARAEVEAHKPPAQKSDKRFIMNRFLRASDTWALSDST